MAIRIPVTEDNGIVTDYHRIALLRIEPHQQNTILVHSYLGEAGRQVEKDYAAGLYRDVDAGMMNFPYVRAKYFHLKYDEEMTITKAYEYLKTLPWFEGGADI